MSNVVFFDFAGVFRRIHLQKPVRSEQGASMTADDAFEADLSAMFDETSEAPDAQAFVRDVEARLDRLQRTRRWLYGVLGTVGAAIGAAVLFGGQAAGALAKADLANPAPVLWLWAGVALVCGTAYVMRPPLED